MSASGNASENASETTASEASDDLDREYNLDSYSGRMELLDAMMKRHREVMAKQIDMGFYPILVRTEMKHITEEQPKFSRRHAETRYDRWWNGPQSTLGETRE